jgi:hypothetical protein
MLCGLDTYLGESLLAAHILAFVRLFLVMDPLMFLHRRVLREGRLAGGTIENRIIITIYAYQE